jgi:hypothetical protein
MASKHFVALDQWDGHLEQVFVPRSPGGRNAVVRS